MSMWVSDYCKLCLIQSRCRDLITLGRADLLPNLLKYLADIIPKYGRVEAFTHSYNYVKSLLNSEDPYKHVKDELSRKALKIAEVVEGIVSRHDWDLSMALEFSAAANSIDTSVLGYEPKELGEVIFDRPVINDFRCVDGDEVLIALDNVGEFEVDLVLVKALVRNGFKVKLLVREESYEIDVTYDEVVGRLNLSGVEVVKTPKNSPPILYVSDGFVISKGIANAEAYLENELDFKVLHLLRAKCDIISEVLKIPKNSSIIIEGKSLIKYFKSKSKL
ncbi:MAG: ARMT1-like domain-containing protein [Sulfolobales archaeon]